MKSRVEFRLSGSGGQGVISAGIILAAAAISDNKYAVQSQSYGPEARGGASKAEVIISTEPIDHPKATIPNYVLCMTDEAFRLYGKTADADTVVFADEDVNTSDCSREIVKIPIIKTAMELNPQGANVIAVGFLVAYTNLITRESTIESLKEQFPQFIDVNIKCVNAGFGFADALR